MDFITDKLALEYINSFPNKPKVSLENIYKHSSKECIDFLNKCLQFNPKKRIRLNEALEHPYFQNVFHILHLRSDLKRMNKMENHSSYHLKHRKSPLIC